jgi:hypothetical protein
MTVAPDVSKHKSPYQTEGTMSESGCRISVMSGGRTGCYVGWIFEKVTDKLIGQVGPFYGDDAKEKATKAAEAKVRELEAQRFTMPEWMKPLARYINDTGDCYSGNPPDEHFAGKVEELLNRRVNANVNLPVAMMQVSVNAQVRLLRVLHGNGLLRGTHQT